MEVQSWLLLGFVTRVSICDVGGLVGFPFGWAIFFL